MTGWPRQRGLTLDELLTSYRVQILMLQKNERRLRFNQRGVAESHLKCAEIDSPFAPVDRDYREAWGRGCKTTARCRPACATGFR